MRKNTKLNFMYILVVIPIYFFSTIFVNHFQQYEYIFTDVNNIKKYQVTSNNDASYAYIKLDNNLYTEGEFSAFEIRKVYEDEDYYRDINDEKFVDIYNFVKRKGTKIGIHREGLL